MMDNVEKLDQIQMHRHHFESKLTLSISSDSDWNHIKKVINFFKIKTLREWHDLYLKIDVLGLTCDWRHVSEYYRKLSFETYGLVPI